MGTKYHAFISYSQQHRQLAQAIQQGLHQLGANRVRLQFRALEVFRDETHFSGTDSLMKKIQRGLEHAPHLVVLCSPEIAEVSNTNWVEQEIRYWLDHHYPDYETQPPEEVKLTLCWVAGELQWNKQRNRFDPATTNALAPSLLSLFQEEPLWVDFRGLTAEDQQRLAYPQFKQKTAEVSAKIQNIPVDRLISQDWKRQRNWRNLLMGVVILLLFLTGAALWQRDVAIIAQGEAEEAQKWALAAADTARMERDTARQARLDAEMQRDSTRLAKIQVSEEQTLRIQAEADAIASVRSEAEIEKIKEAYRLISLAQQVEETDPTTALRIAESALKKYDSPDIRKRATEMYSNGNTFACFVEPQPWLYRYGWGELSPSLQEKVGVASDGRINVIDIKGNLLRVIGNDTSVVVEATWSGTGDSIFAVYEDGSLRLWNKTGELLKDLEGYSNPGSFISRSPNGLFFWVGYQDGTIQIYDHTGLLINYVNTGYDKYGRVFWSGSNQHLVIEEWKGERGISIWSTKGELLYQFFDIRMRGIEAIAWGEDDDILFSFRLDPALIWHYGTDSLQRLNTIDSIFQNLPTSVEKALWSKNGKRLYLGNRQTTYILDSEGNLLSVIPGLIIDSSPDNSLLAILDKNEVTITNLDGELLCILKGHTSRVYSIEWLLESNQVITYSIDDTKRKWNLPQFKPIESVYLDTEIQSVNWSPSSNDLLVLSDESPQFIWSIDKDSIQLIDSTYNRPFSADWAPSGDSFLILPKDRQLTVCDANGHFQFSFNQDSCQIYNANWSPNGEYIGALCTEGIMIWSRGGEPWGRFIFDTHLALSYCWAPNSEEIAIGFWSGQIGIYNISNGKLMKSFKGHDSRVLSLLYSPRNGNLVSSSDDGAIIWSKDGVINDKIENNGGYINLISWSPSGDGFLYENKNEPNVSSGDYRYYVWRFNESPMPLNNSRITPSWSPSGDRLLGSNQNANIITFQDNDGLYLPSLISLKPFETQENVKKTTWDYIFGGSGFSSYSWSPDGKFIAAVKSNSVIEIWQAPPTLNDFLASDQLAPLTQEQKELYGIE